MLLLGLKPVGFWCFCRGVFVVKKRFHGPLKLYSDCASARRHCHLQVLTHEGFQLLVESARHGNRDVSMLVGASSEVTFPDYPRVDSDQG